MHRLVAALGAALALAAAAGVGAAPIGSPSGFVTDQANVVPPPVEARITRLLEELRAKTGAEIAVVTVDTTAPLDDFTYALRIAEAWKPGRAGEDTGVVFLVAVGDRRLRVLVGYGLEGVLPDGLVGEIEDTEVVPAFRAGRLDEGIWRGVAAVATRIAASRGVELTGAPAPAPPRRAARPLPGWVLLLLVLLALGLMLYQASAGPRRFRRRGVSPWGYGGFGGFGGGGGGFGGFGGGRFGGGGAGRSW
jgi:uncharacterized protein